MKRIIIAIIFFTAQASLAQTVADFDVIKGAQGYPAKKMKDAPKKVYIASFAVNYQLLLNLSETDHGGSQMGGGHRGKATATLVLGVPGIEPQSLQDLTDKLYTEYVDKLTSQGFEIVSPDEAGKTEYYSDYTQLKGGTISEAQNPGFLSTAPTGYEWYVKKVTKKGRAKASIFDNGQKVSKDLDGAIVANVTLNIPAFEEAESQGSKALTKSFGGVAKVVAKPNFRIAPSIYVQRGSMSGSHVLSQNAFISYKNVKSAGQVSYTVKKPIQIEGVFEEKKYKAVESGRSVSGTSLAGSLSMFSVYDRVQENIQMVPCDPDKFINGAYEASSKYLNKTLEIFFKAAAGEKIK